MGGTTGVGLEGITTTGGAVRFGCGAGVVVGFELGGGGGVTVFGSGLVVVGMGVVPPVGVLLVCAEIGSASPPASRMERANLFMLHISTLPAVRISSP